MGEESRKLKEDIKEARRKIYDNFMDDQTEDNRKDVDMITRLEIEKQKNDDDLRLKEEEAEFNYEQAEKDEARKQELHDAQLAKLKLESDLAVKRYHMEIADRVFNDVGTVATTAISAGIVKDMIRYDKEKPFPLPRDAFNAARNFFERCSRGWGKIFKR